MAWSGTATRGNHTAFRAKRVSPITTAKTGPARERGLSGAFAVGVES